MSIDQENGKPRLEEMVVTGWILSFILGRTFLLVYILACWPGILLAHLLSLHGYSNNEIAVYFYTISWVWIYLMYTADNFAANSYLIIRESLTLQ